MKREEVLTSEHWLYVASSSSPGEPFSYCRNALCLHTRRMFVFLCFFYKSCMSFLPEILSPLSRVPWLSVGYVWCLTSSVLTTLYPEFLLAVTHIVWLGYKLFVQKPFLSKSQNVHSAKKNTNLVGWWDNSCEQSWARHTGRDTWCSLVSLWSACGL